ncbi:N-acetylmuramoyl-L-alanine amidase [Tumidithrix helvetica PCC 7403]|uniref:N-acetylmuramoyl-L-alanine amidase n=1 Tax=Tumidithrix helvetica TaxID=3457545 RepID=UPI003CAE4813
MNVRRTLQGWTKRFFLSVFLAVVTLLLTLAAGAQMRSPQLHLTYPPLKHETYSNKIFFIGSAPPEGVVTINGVAIERNAAGHFAPSLPLQLGQNSFTLEYQNSQGQKQASQAIATNIIRLATRIAPPSELGFISDSLLPKQDIAIQPNERICFEAIATPNADVSVFLGDRTISLKTSQSETQLPPNYAVLTGNNQPSVEPAIGKYLGCTAFANSGILGKPEFRVTKANQTIRQPAQGIVEVLSPDRLQIVEVTVPSAITRTGASSDFSRLTPLPKGSKALITGRQGDWFRLDYGAWINRKSVRIQDVEAPIHSTIHSLGTKKVSNWTEITFPLEVPVPMTVAQGDRTLTLTLHNVTAQTDTILIGNDPAIGQITWQQIASQQNAPSQVVYTIGLKSSQQWGYKLRYEGSSLVLSIKHPPLLRSQPAAPQPLAGIKIVLDPGHGGDEDLGTRSPTGYPEKTATLITSKFLQAELQKRGATVVMTRDKDIDLGLEERVDTIDRNEPAIALSIHYNALPDDGDAINTAGVGAFWYHPQSSDLARFLQNYLVKQLNRPDYGVYWANLALVRSTTTPSVLLELGFMINPDEFEWIVDPEQQQRLATAIADGITAWFAKIPAS